ncbi:hypothetical protein FC88_GL000008 [Companilactobacillus futsaii JCM 17355]|nr:hypothetical protein FC88_GL000008 [Companilactobacillus futsaii JCM 17355]
MGTVMSAKDGKMDKFIKGVDKLTDSKGISKLGKTLNKTIDIAGNIISSTAEVTNHQIDERNKRHQFDIKLPDISGLSLDQTKDLFDSINIKYAFVKVDPDVKLVSTKVDTVLKTVPKPKTVLPAGGFVKIYYLDSEGLEQSQKILADSVHKKQVRKESTKALFDKVGQGTAAGANKVLKVSKKLVLHSKRPKKIKATIVEKPKDSNEVDK